jgi:hypothetical protein
MLRNVFQFYYRCTSVLKLDNFNYIYENFHIAKGLLFDQIKITYFQSIFIIILLLLLNAVLFKNTFILFLICLLKYFL